MLDHISKSDINDVENVILLAERYFMMERKIKTANRQNAIVKIPLSQIAPNPDQPRKRFDQELIKTLANSFEDRMDVDYPILVTPRKSKNGDKIYLIIDGERRYRAACKMELGEISCCIHEEMNDDQVYFMSARANLCRVDISPIEEAKMIKKIMDSHMLTQAEVSRKLGLTQFRISNILKYLKLNDGLQQLVHNGEIKKGDALKFASYPKEVQDKLFKKFRIYVMKHLSGGKNCNVKLDTNRILKKIAGELGVKPVVGAKKRRQLSYCELVFKNTRNKMHGLIAAIGEFEDIDIEEIQDKNGYDDLLEFKRLVWGISNKIEAMKPTLEKLI